MPTNFYMYFVAALIPMVVGAAYYHPKAVGGPWMKENGFTMESLEGGNMAKIFGFAYLLSVILAMGIGNFAIHQTQVVGLTIPEVLESGSQAQKDVNAFFATYGDRHRNFGHGAVHGIIAAIMFGLPLFGINALFERKSWKYNLIHFGYWAITLALMGGLLCATLDWAPLS